MHPDTAHLPRPPHHLSDRWPETRYDPAYQAFLDAHAAYWGSEECVVLPKFAASAMRTVANWRRGDNVLSVLMPAGTPVASFMDRKGNPSILWDGGQGLGITGNATTHAGVLAGYLLDAGGAVIGLKLWEIYPGAGRVRRRIYPVDDAKFGTANARAYHAIFDTDMAPLGRYDNPYYAQWLQNRTARRRNRPAPRRNIKSAETPASASHDTALTACKDTRE